MEAARRNGLASATSSFVRRQGGTNLTAQGQVRRPGPHGRAGWARPRTARAVAGDRAAAGRRQAGQHHLPPRPVGLAHQARRPGPRGRAGRRSAPVGVASARYPAAASWRRAGPLDPTVVFAYVLYLWAEIGARLMPIWRGGRSVAGAVL